MTARLDVTPKTTEQNRIVCTSKSEDEVTNNKKTALEVLYCWRNEANYWQTRSIARPLCDSRATCWVISHWTTWPCSNVVTYRCAEAGQMLPCTRLQSSPLCTRRTCQWSCRRRSRDGSEIQQPATAKCRFTDTVVAVFVFVFLICFQWRIQRGAGGHAPPP